MAKTIRKPRGSNYTPEEYALLSPEDQAFYRDDLRSRGGLNPAVADALEKSPVLIGRSEAIKKEADAKQGSTNQAIAGYRTLLWRNYFNRKNMKSDNGGSEFMNADNYNPKNFDFIASRETGNLEETVIKAPAKANQSFESGGNGRPGWRAFDRIRNLDPGKRLLGQQTGVSGSIFNPVRRLGFGIDNTLRRNIKF